jgi:hypothetical protein
MPIHLRTLLLAFAGSLFLTHCGPDTSGGVNALQTTQSALVDTTITGQVTLSALNMAYGSCDQPVNGLLQINCAGTIQGTLSLPRPGPLAFSITLQGATQDGSFLHFTVAIDGVAELQADFYQLTEKTITASIPDVTDVLQPNVILYKPGPHVVQVTFSSVPTKLATPIAVRSVSLSYGLAPLVPTTLKGGLMENIGCGYLRLVGGRYVWVQDCGGSLRERVNFPTTGVYRFTISAAGDCAGGAWPLMQLAIDGVKVGTPVSVGSAAFSSYTFDATVVNAGEHWVSVLFINDYNGSPPGPPGSPSTNRNLLVDTVRIAMAPSAPFVETTCVSDGTMAGGTQLFYDVMILNDGQGNRTLSLNSRPVATSSFSVANYTGLTRTDSATTRTYKSSTASLSLTLAADQSYQSNTASLSLPDRSINEVGTLNCFVSKYESASYVPACQEITAPGNYTLSASLTEGSPTEGCVNIHDVSDVQLDCRGLVITAARPVRFDNTTRVEMTRCALQTNGATPPTSGISNQLLTMNQSNVSFVVRNRIGVGTPSVSWWSDLSQASWLRLHGNVLQEGYASLRYSADNWIEDNVFLTPAMKSGVANIVLEYGAYNFVAYNWMDGRWDTVSGNNGIGVDDNVTVEDETGDNVIENDLRNAWDCGIETVGVVKNAKFARNRMHNVSTGIGGWYYNSLINSVIDNNVVEQSGSLFYFTRIYGLRPAGWDDRHQMPADTGVYFINNQITSNQLIQPWTSNNPYIYAGVLPVFEQMQYTDLGTHHPGEVDPTPDQFFLTNNFFQSNDFSKVLTAPHFGSPTAPGFIIDGGGNKCVPDPSSPGYPITCL